MALAAGAAQDADRALRTIEDAGRAVLRDVRWMVGLLRDDAERAGLRDVASLVGTARRSGLSVELDEEGELTAASDDAGEAAYRIVQEALTNVVRHSGGQHVRVHVGVRGGEVAIEVRDEGSPAADVEPGHGLTGMQERVAALGGHLRAGPDPGGGWTVSALLPLQGRAR
jgi:signal transduction histidine kinase